jgi:hypothetical protein
VVAVFGLISVWFIVAARRLAFERTLSLEEAPAEAKTISTADGNVEEVKPADPAPWKETTETRRHGEEG